MEKAFFPLIYKPNNRFSTRACPVLDTGSNSIIWLARKSYSNYYINFLFFSLKELLTTITELKAIASPAKAGFKSEPKNG